MRNYDYQDKWKALLTPRVVRNLMVIHEYRGEQRIIVGRHADVLENFVEVAKMQSAESSNRMEGIQTSDERLKKIMLNKTMPKNRMEREIAGYRDVLNMIHENSEHIPVRSTFILQFHRELYKYENTKSGGVFKNVDDETSESVDRLCKAYRDAVGHAEVDTLLLIPMFMVDFLCICPFQCGNGRMSRLLMQLLLYQSDYNVGKYISVERRIEKETDTYYRALQESFKGWREEENNYEPFVDCLLRGIAAAYREFSDRTRRLEEKKITKPDRVEEEIRNTVGTITKAELMEKASGVSQTTIQRTLTELVKKGKIRKIGGGRYTKYEWNREDGQQ